MVIFFLLNVYFSIMKGTAQLDEGTQARTKKMPRFSSTFLWAVSSGFCLTNSVRTITDQTLDFGDNTPV